MGAPGTVVVGVAGATHLAIFAGFLPYVAIKTSAHLRSRPFPAKVRHFTAQMLVLLVFLGLSALVAKREWIPIFPPELPQPRMLVLGAAVLVAMIVLMRPLWKQRVAERSRKAWLFMPRTPRERLLWAGCSLAAGVSEEVTYRGVMFTLLWRLTGSALAAALLMSAVFAVSHFMQGWKSMAIIYAIAMTFQMITWVSGTLYVAMGVHFLYDLAAGLHYGRYGDELGYPVEAMPPEEAPRGA
jgi:membrane protease YdiL (CAAX protease family)